MFIHFDNRAAAISHLEENGWRQINNGNWVSKDGTCAAEIIPRIGFGEVVQIHFWEIA